MVDETNGNRKSCYRLEQAENKIAIMEGDVIQMGKDFAVMVQTMRDMRSTLMWGVRGITALILALVIFVIQQWIAAHGIH